MPSLFGLISLLHNSMQHSLVAQWLGCMTLNHMVMSPTTARSSFGIGLINQGVPDMTRWLCNYHICTKYRRGVEVSVGMNRSRSW